MDAYEIALLMANQDAQNPLAMRYGTVQSLNDDGSVSVVPDGQDQAVPAVKCCRLCAGNRVVLLVNGTEWLAVSVMGGECPYEIGDVWTTFSDDSPHDRWPGTTWEQIRDRFLLASGSRGAGATGGEESHVLTQPELPLVEGSFAIRGVGDSFIDAGSNAWGAFYRTGYSSGAWIVTYLSAEGLRPGYSGFGMSFGQNQPHNNMPPYMVAHMWKRTA
ncbi:phage baseplate protein [Gordonibacter massiliensis (ex Traore et al. 2017)]|uniref:Baseplate structural protein Gp10 C-terminal domain-containing protein n=1 Tax=Gordonibacter massiliensis (ex Traore et al. 2017) TaxID=1841863 RepID=A0A842J9T5_9ACTN|nr:hypothetical protein [Gordonibacter massiliensis (ex Traore et al. 2017)]MBC2888563.1 hypothetical protein [Gordonibacter massiliensis (ex Traore et al. 2017)]